jgi:hypothetical protein
MKFQLIEGYQKFYAMWSMWAFAIVGAAPDLYNLAVQYNLLEGDSAPAQLARIINTIAFLGAASRMIKQNKLALPVSAKSDSAQ